MQKFTPHNSRVVAIVGRPNVGKSALFNRLAGHRIAIVHDMPGVTRDRLSAPVKDSTFPIQIIDTGGIGATLGDGFADQVKAEAIIAVESADLILFVVDALEGRHVIDDTVAAILRKQNKPVVLGINKSDDAKHDRMMADFSRMGFKNVVSFSATHGRGIEKLLRTMEENLIPPPAEVEGEEGEGKPLGEPIRMAIIGRPNVGKSSLFNAILGEERAIVSEVAGTTRDSVDSLYQRGEHYFQLIDTAGIRKQARVDTVVESFSVARAESSIRRADLVALVFDCSRGITAQERKIAGTILEENKPCILVGNKYDLWHPDAQQKARLEELEEYARRELYFLHYAPLVAVSAKGGQFLNKVFGAIERVKKSSADSLSTGALNRVLQDAIARTPPPHIKGKRFKLLYATLTRDINPRPIIAPRVVLFVNHRELLHETYLRFLENEIRRHTPYEGLPIKFDIRERVKQTVSERKEGRGKRRAAEARDAEKEGE
jgi:GTP-binding protein